MLEIEYFGNLEHYCFKKMLSQICDVTDDVIKNLEANC